MVQLKNRVSGLQMETGVSHNKQRLHKIGYFEELMDTSDSIGEVIRHGFRLTAKSFPWGFQ